VLQLANLAKVISMEKEMALETTAAAATARRAKATIADPRWQSLVTRDAAADGQFYYSVKTTGVYCRPSCASRLARPENVQFHRTREDAEKSGFRPCKRCKPDQPAFRDLNAKKIAAACRLIERSDETPSLEALAKHAGMSISHFHRSFKAATGLTPKHFAEAHRSSRVRKSLARSTTVTNAIYDAGFNSNSRFYESSNGILGMTPSRYRRGGAGTDIHFAVGQCSLGSILVAQTQKGVCSILLGDDPGQLLRDLEKQFPNANLIGAASGYEKLVAQVVGLIEQPGLGFQLPLDIRGTAFQQRVWKALRQIPPGSTASYSEIARKLGMPKAVRAVAQACGANGLAVAIPCHRVVRNDGLLSGYRWGVERKRVLLEREAHT
jgi:AraC family transcriptional regulator of adaptative response/methylated-DNA-[protein]-cysteine methyltransferase